MNTIRPSSDSSIDGADVSADNGPVGFQRAAGRDSRNSVFRLLFNSALCLIVLACPAQGGRCCATDQALGDPQAHLSSDCHECCCTHDEPSDSPFPKSPNRCTTCFCVGALPAGPSAADVIPRSRELTQFAQSSSADVDRIARVVSIDQRHGHSPPHGRSMLAFYCTLLL